MNIVVRRTDTGIFILVVPDRGEEDESRALGRLIEHFRYADDPGDPDADELHASGLLASKLDLDQIPRWRENPAAHLAGIPVYLDETVPPGVVELRRRGETVGTIRL